MQIIAIIPARGGSKGIPKKNIKKLNGKPLIAYSIEKALESKYINDVYVSTDCPYIAKIARIYKAKVPILRPKEISQDFSRDEEFIKHWLDYLSSSLNKIPDLIVQLRPTSPIRQIKNIEKGIEMMIENKNATSLRCLSIPSNNPFKMWRIEENNTYIKPILECNNIIDAYDAPRQILPKIYWQNGYMDIIRVKDFLKTGSLSGKNIIGHFIKEKVIDIDTFDDFKEAEKLLKREKN